MSVEASMRVKYSISQEKTLSIVQIMQLFLLEGWTFSDNGRSSYLPLGETEGFDWVIQEQISSELLMNILKEKERLSEPIGIVMTWQDTGIGGLFIFRRPQELSILLNINRKAILGEDYTSITDASWYLSRLIPVFDKNNIHVIYFAFEQLS